MLGDRLPYLNVELIMSVFLGISVGNRKVPIPAGTFDTTQDGGGFVIDSGTTMTTLRKEAYDPLVQMLREAINLPQKGAVLKITFTCVFEVLLMIFPGWKETNYNDSFARLKQLKMLNLRENYFNDSVFSYLNKLTSLTTLNLNSNRIITVRPKQGLANLRNLQELDLSGNKITELGLENLRNLEVLDLSENEINRSP
ncbi:LRR receptor-like kinase family protein, partial [Melia azedarach]